MCKQNPACNHILCRQNLAEMSIVQTHHKPTVDGYLRHSPPDKLPAAAESSSSSRKFQPNAMALRMVEFEATNSFTPVVKKFKATNSFAASYSMMPPQLSMVTESIIQTRCVPQPFWEINLRPLLLTHPNGVTCEELEDIFYEEYGTPLNPPLFGYESTIELLNDKEDICISCRKIFLDWGCWPTEQ